MTFVNLKFPIMFDYAINKSIIQLFDIFVTNITMVFSRSQAKPNLHIELACCKALKILGFNKQGFFFSIPF